MHGFTSAHLRYTKQTKGHSCTARKRNSFAAAAAASHHDTTRHTRNLHSRIRRHDTRTVGGSMCPDARRCGVQTDAMHSDDRLRSRFVCHDHDATTMTYCVDIAIGHSIEHTPLYTTNKTTTATTTTTRTSLRNSTSHQNGNKSRDACTRVNPPCERRRRRARQLSCARAAEILVVNWSASRGPLICGLCCAVLCTREIVNYARVHGDKFPREDAVFYCRWCCAIRYKY